VSTRGVEDIRVDSVTKTLLLRVAHSITRPRDREQEPTAPGGRVDRHVTTAADALFPDYIEIGRRLQRLEPVRAPAHSGASRL
jgi:hypothetical protein